MKILDSFEQRIRGLLTTPLAELGSWARLARGQIHLWRFCVRRLGDNNVLAMSSALSFRTIFALIPTIIVAFLAMKSLGIVEDSKQMLREFLDRTGMTQITYVTPPAPADAAPGQPAPAEAQAEAKITVAEKVESLVDHVEGQLTIGRLGPVSVVLLIWSALTLLTTAERCMNRVFDVPRARGFGRRVLVYWSSLTLGPLLVVVAIRAGGSLVESVRNVPILAWTLGPVGWVAPIAVGILFVAALYALLPNTRVAFGTALKGAILAVPIWLVAKWGFSLYVRHVGSTSLYGALGLLPLFLLWLNLSWWIFLFGAQVAYAAANVSRLIETPDQDGHPLTPWHDVAAVLAVARAQRTLGGPAPAADVAAALGLAPHRTQALLQRLTEAGILVRAEGSGPVRCVLAVPAEMLPVSRLLLVRCPDNATVPEGAGDAAIASAVADVRRRAEAGVQGLTLADLLNRGPEPGGSAPS